MNEAAKVVLSLSLSGTWMIAILLLMRPLLKNRLGQRWQYYIWLVVIARLLLPWAPENSLVGRLFTDAQRQIRQAVADNSVDSSAADDAAINEDMPEAFSGEPDFAYDYGIEAAGGIGDKEPQKSSLAWRRLMKDTLGFAAQNIGLIWLAGVLLLSVRRITVYQSFAKYVKAGCVSVEDMDLLERFGEIVRQGGVKGMVELKVNRMVSSPMLIGIFRPCVVLTSTEIPEAEFRYIALHELTHYKRGDLFYKWLVQFTICLHWFNPFVHLMGYEIDRMCELSCDEAVIAGLTDEEKRAYGDTLLNAVGNVNSRRSPAASAALYESRKLLKERLGAIMKYRKKTPFAIAVAFVITILLVSGAAVSGAYAKPAEKVQESHVKIFDNSNMVKEDGIYYIFSEGATEADKPIGGITKGSIGLCLVRKTGYVSLAPFSDVKELAAEAETLCRGFLKNGNITQEEKNLILDAVREIRTREEEEGTSYYYTQSAYYEEPCIFQVGWNMRESDYASYKSRKITLPDGTQMKVFFDDSCIDSIRDDETGKALAVLLERLKAETAGKDYNPLRVPFVVDIEYIGGNDIYVLEEQFYQDGKIAQFCALYSALDENMQKGYLDRAFEDGKIAFFAASLEKMKPGAEIIDDYAEKAYRTGNISFFAVLSDEMSEAARRKWILRAASEDRVSFLSVLTD